MEGYKFRRDSLFLPQLKSQIRVGNHTCSSVFPGRRHLPSRITKIRNMERALASWMEENQERLKTASLEVVLIEEQGVELKVDGGFKFQLIVPCAALSESGDDDDIFMAFSLGKQEENSVEFEKRVKSLNEKVQTVQPGLGSTALKMVMDHILTAFGGGQREFKEVDKKVEKMVSSGGNSGLLKAVMTEFKNLSRAGAKVGSGEGSGEGFSGDFISGIAVEMPDESDICKWHVRMNMRLFKESRALYGDLQKFASKNGNGKEGAVLLEVSFPKDYPFAPPFVRVLSPKFRFHTGHVTVGGSICAEVLTPSGWLPSFSMENVLVQIQHAIVEGGGRLELQASASDIRRDYTHEEARSAFLRVGRDHGWIN